VLSDGDVKSGGTRSSQVAAMIKADILAGRLAPGQRLGEVALAERYGVSRVPVREALRQLHAERLVEIIANRGAFVPTFDLEEQAKLVEVRLSLEELIVRRAALHRTDEDIERLHRIVDAGQEAAAEGEKEQLVALNTEFHRALGLACRNEIAAGLVEQLRTRVEFGYAGKLPRRAEASWAEHRAILDAVVAGEPDAAGALLRVHLTNAARAAEAEASGV
jgi:DNA-binding GntR family transcriptional regulator